MRDIDYGVVRVNLKTIMKEQGVSISEWDNTESGFGRVGKIVLCA